MPAFAPATHKLVTATTLNPKDDVRVDARDALARLFLDMGVVQIQAQNTPPSNRDVMWWHIEVRQLKRYDGVQGNWFPLTPNQAAMHLVRRAILGSQVDAGLETGDLFMFWDVSLGELKVITRENLMNALGSVRTIATQEGVQGGGTLAANRTLRLDVNGLIAKAVPAGADTLAIYSQADGAHRKSTVEQIAAALALSELLHREIYFNGNL